MTAPGDGFTVDFDPVAFQQAEDDLAGPLARFLATTGVPLYLRPAAQAWLDAQAARMAAQPPGSLST